MLLAEKGVDIDTVNVDLRAEEQFTDEFKALNPLCTVPVLLLDDGTCLTESLAICHYLEATYPQPRLMGHDAREQALVLMWNDIVMFNGYAGVADSLRNFSRSFADRALPGPQRFEQVPALVERGRARAEHCFDTLDARLGESAYLAGDQFSYADICAFVYTEFARWIKLEATGGRTNLRRWHQQVAARPSAAS
jgi:glutathione S-transferase